MWTASKIMRRAFVVNALVGDMAGLRVCAVYEFCFQSKRNRKRHIQYYSFHIFITIDIELR